MKTFSERQQKHETLLIIQQVKELPQWIVPFSDDIPQKADHDFCRLFLSSAYVLR